MITQKFICPVCKRKFVPVREWQIYDTSRCRLRAFTQRMREAYLREKQKGQVGGENEN